jgi:hypothetical protein
MWLRGESINVVVVYTERSFYNHISLEWRRNRV